MKMVQRKAPNKLGIQADLIITSHDHHLHHQNISTKQSISNSHHHQDGKTRKPEGKRKMMKKSRSFKSPPSPKTPPSRDGPTTSPKNYMKSTSCFEARKSTSSGKKKTAKVAAKSSLTMTKTRSFKKKAGLFGGQVAEVQRATCSSTLKDSKFPSYLELSRGGTESEGISAVKVCPYIYCSLNGHLHKHASLPPLKRFLSAKRRALSKTTVRPESEEKVGFFVEIYADKEEEEEQEQVVLESVSHDEPLRFDEETIVDEEESSGFNGSIDAQIYCDEDACEDLFEDGAGDFDDGGEEIKEECFEAEEEDAKKEEDRREEENASKEDIQSSNLFVESSQSDEETMDIEGEEESFCFGGLIDSRLCCDEDECGDSSEDEAEEFDVGEEIEESFEAEEDQSDKACGQTNDCEDIASSGLSHSSVVEESSDLEIVDHEDTNEDSENSPNSGLTEEIASSDLPQSSVVEESSDLEIIEDVDTNETNKNGPSSVVIEEIANPDQEIIDASAQNMEIHHDSESRPIGKKQRESSDPLEDEDELRSKWKRSKREAEDSEVDSARGFNPRGPNFLELTLEPEGEKVDLKHQEADKRKSSEEWMIDRALQRTLNELGQRKRRVALLVEAFETVTPIVNHHRSHYRHIPSSPVFPHAICPVQACN